MRELNEMDEHTQEVLQQVAIVSNRDIQEVAGLVGEMMRAIEKAVTPVMEIFGDIAVGLSDLPRPPAEIKKDIKHEKNPMRLIQLNKELNKSYKAYKRK